MTGVRISESPLHVLSLHTVCTAYSNGSYKINTSLKCSKKKEKKEEYKIGKHFWLHDI